LPSSFWASALRVVISLVKISTPERMRVAYLKDLSEGGVFIRTDKPLQLERVVDVDLLAPGRLGDVLTATVLEGKTWEKQGRRAGKLVFSETITEYRDQNGELVVTARGVGVRTERPATSG